MGLLFKSVKKKETVQQVRKDAEEEQKVEKKIDPKVRIQQLLDAKDPEIAARSLEDRIEECRTLVEKKTKVTEKIFMDWIARKTKERRDREKKEKDARWKASKFTGKELWFRTGTKKDDDDDAIDDYEHSSNAPSEDEGEEDES